MTRSVICIQCKKEVEVNRYGKVCKKPKKEINYVNSDSYTCSVCRGINTPKKSKLPPKINNGGFDERSRSAKNSKY
jgi:hypothetical protein